MQCLAAKSAPEDVIGNASVEVVDEAISNVASDSRTAETRNKIRKCIRLCFVARMERANSSKHCR